MRLLPFLCLLLPACSLSSGTAAPFLPPPTEHRLDPGYEAQNKSARKAWQAAMHRAEAGLDWKSIERQNGLDAMARRQGPGGRQSPVPGSWRELGSRNQAGRMHSSVLVNGSTLYSGSSLGGIWRGTRDGQNWTPLGDNLWGGGKVIVVVPGQGGANDVILRLQSNEVHRSDNLGQTWALVQNGLTNISSLGSLLLMDNGDVLLVGRDNGVSIGGWGIFASTDAGASFSLRYDLGTGGNGKLQKHRTLPGRLLMLQRDQLFTSHDYGLNFSPSGSPMPVSLSGSRVRISEATNPLTVYVMGKDNGTTELWRSPDAGATWNHVHTPQEWWSSFEVSIHNPDLVTWGGVECWVSRNGGASAQVVNSWGSYYGNPAGCLHADIQSLKCYPDPGSSTGEVWYIGTDGGVYDSSDQLQSVRNLSLDSLGVSQYYTTFTSLRRPDLVLAGSQDQGYQRAELGTPSGGGPWADFDQLISGDYGHASSYNGTHDMVFSPYPGFVLVQDGEDNPALVAYEDFPSGSNPLWLPPVVADPDYRTAFFLCADDAIWRCKRQGMWSWNWTVHSTTSFGGKTVSALRFSPLDSQLAWAATTDGTLWYSTDHAVTWQQSTTTGPGSHYFYGTAIWCSRTNPDEVWVGGSGYSTSPVWRSLDGGTTFQAESNGLPSTLVYSLCESPDQSGRMFCGTETNAWSWDPSTSTWEDLTTTGAPLTTYWSVESIRETNTIRFGTYGRGIWDYELDTPGSFPYGQLRGDANIVKLDSSETPTLGNNFTVSISEAPALASGWFLVSRERQDVSQSGGSLLINDSKTVIQAPIKANLQGEVSFSGNVPSKPSFAGSEWFAQAFFKDSSQTGGWAMSNGLQIVVGP
ncbi:MAG: hypothetical protein QF389_03205 [Planctomycetota bacterium]|nr:hypothetical protein [Planctomycetota bacterium]